MKHATDPALDRVEPLLRELRKLELLREKKRGTFYRKSNAFLHFHEDPAGMFCDIKVAGVFQRLPVNTAAERKVLLRAARAEL
jgi:hypothetical protein